MIIPEAIVLRLCVVLNDDGDGGMDVMGRGWLVRQLWRGVFTGGSGDDGGSGAEMVGRCSW